MNFIALALNKIQNKYYFISPHERDIGITTEDVRNGLNYCKINSRKLVIVHRWNKLFPLQWSKAPNDEIFHIQSDIIAKSSLNVKLIKLLVKIVLTIYYGIAYWFISYILKNLISFVKGGSGKLVYILTGNSKYRSGWIRYHLANSYPIPRIGVKESWNPFNSKIFSLSEVEQQKSIYQNPFSYNIELSKKGIVEAKRDFKQLGLPEDAPFICLHAREGGFFNDHQNARNSQIFNYLPTLETLASKGFWLVRLGDRSMTRLPVMKQVIDYPFSPVKSGALDLYLMKHCQLFVGCQSGPGDLAMLFQKKMVLVNLIDWISSMPILLNGLAIFKHVFTKGIGEPVPLKDYLQAGKYFGGDFNGFPNHFDYQENTPEEILSVVLEALNENGSTSYSEIQAHFQYYRREKIKVFFETPDLWQDKSLDLLYKFKYAARCLYSEGRVGESYLKNKWE